MALHMIGPPETLTLDPTADAPAALNDLLALASWLAVRWDELDEKARPALVRRIQQVASDLGRQTNGNGVGHHASVDGHELLGRLSLLTPREVEVLQAMAYGHTTARIADVLGISTGTVRSHVKSLLGKLGLHSRVEAVSLILRTNGRPEGSLNV
jgi:DNA-binding NarL/FixJ family response regulator